MRHYDNVSMKEGEFMDDMFQRLQVLLNELETPSPKLRFTWKF